MHRVGFLLAEMACALLLVSLMSLILARCYHTMLCIEQDSIRRLHALALVQECAEWFEGSSRLTTFDTSLPTDLRDAPHHARNWNAFLTMRGRKLRRPCIVRCRAKRASNYEP